MNSNSEKYLNLGQIKQLAIDYGLEYKQVKAVVDVESSGSGFDKQTGLIKIQFEPAWFQRLAHIVIQNGVEGQQAEWKAFNQAYAINPNAAMQATSWGLGQIMGFNYHSAGYTDVETMVSDFEQSEYNQLKGMLNHIKSKDKLFNALKASDWKTVAYFYNGEAYQKFNYDKRLRDAYMRV